MLEKVLRRALDAEPERRFASARDFQLALEEILRLLPEPSNASRLAEYLVGELEGTADLAPTPKDSLLADDDGLLAGNFELLDPPLPDSTQVRRADARAQGAMAPLAGDRAVVHTHWLFKALGALLLAPAWIFGAVAMPVRWFAAALSRR